MNRFYICEHCQEGLTDRVRRLMGTSEEMAECGVCGDSAALCKNILAVHLLNLAMHSENPF